MEYAALLRELNNLKDEGYRAFHERLLNDARIRVIGVRMPALRSLSARYSGEYADFLSFPSEYYEVTLLKCLTLGRQPYEVFVSRLGEVLPLLDNWAVCDLFTAPCVENRLGEFLGVLTSLRFSPHEFTSRYALVNLLRYYCKEEYLPVVFESAEGCDHEKYYVSMAAAWLVAEVLVRMFERGVAFLRRGTLPKKTHNRAVRKAQESLRLTAAQKRQLNALKRR